MIDLQSDQIAEKKVVSRIEQRERHCDAIL